MDHIAFRQIYEMLLAFENPFWPYFAPSDDMVRTGLEYSLIYC